MVEDYCRFVLNDSFLCGELKQLRHDFTAALAFFPVERLLEARETQSDVGVLLSTEPNKNDPHSPPSPSELEATSRGLAQPGRVRQNGRPRPRPGDGTIALSLLHAGTSGDLGAAARERLADVRLCLLLTGLQCVRSLEETIKEATAGGVGMIQLREKDLSDRNCWNGRARFAAGREAGVLFLVNDRPDMARGRERRRSTSGPRRYAGEKARRILGPDALIGVSTHSIEQVRQAVLDGASYLGVGPTFPSRTKKFSEFPGLDFVRGRRRDDVAGLRHRRRQP